MIMSKLFLQNENSTLTLFLLYFTFFGVDRGLFWSNASALRLVKNEGGSAGKLVGFAINTVVESEG